MLAASLLAACGRGRMALTTAAEAAGLGARRRALPDADLLRGVEPPCRCRAASAAGARGGRCASAPRTERGERGEGSSLPALGIWAPWCADCVGASPEATPREAAAAAVEASVLGRRA